MNVGKGLFAPIEGRLRAPSQSGSPVAENRRLRQSHILFPAYLTK